MTVHLITLQHVRNMLPKTASFTKILQILLSYDHQSIKGREKGITKWICKVSLSEELRKIAEDYSSWYRSRTSALSD